LVTISIRAGITPDIQPIRFRDMILMLVAIERQCFNPCYCGTTVMLK